MKYLLPFGATVHEYHPDDRVAFLGWVARARPYLAVDTETTGTEWADTVRLVQFGDETSAWVLRADRDAALIGQVLAGPHRFVAWNAAFDTAKLYALTGVDILDRTSDTAVLAGVLDPRGDYQGGVGRGLKPWAVYVVGQEAEQPDRRRKDLWHENGWTESQGWALVPIDHPVYVRYAGADPILTYRVHQYLSDQVRQRSSVVRREQQVMRITARARATGFLLDAGYSETLRLTHAHGLAATMAELAPLGVRSLGSSQQIAARLEEEGLEELIEYTELGNVSVPKKVLKRAAAAGSDVAALIRAGRHHKRIAQDLCEMFQVAARSDGRVHPGLRPIGAKTRRMSCSRPNLQSVQKEKGIATPVRGCLIPEPGHLLIAADYSQMELRYAAHISGDQRLIADIINAADIMLELAEQIWPGNGLAMRQIAKIALYATLYGAGERLLSDILGLTREDARRFRASLAARYPVLWNKLQQVQASVRATGGVMLPLSGWLPTRADKPHVGFNLLVQGGCRDFFGDRLVALDHVGTTPMLRLPLHDEAILSVPRNDADDVIETLRTHMPIRTDDGLYIPVSIKTGTSWGHLEDYKGPATLA